MVLFEIIPNEENYLPVTGSKQVTITYLLVGDTKIKNCTFRLGENEPLFFTLGNTKVNDMLYINGNPEIKMTYELVPFARNKVTLELAEGISPTTDAQIFRVCCYFHNE